MINRTTVKWLDSIHRHLYIDSRQIVVCNFRIKKILVLFILYVSTYSLRNVNAFITKPDIGVPPSVPMHNSQHDFHYHYKYVEITVTFCKHCNIIYYFFVRRITGFILRIYTRGSLNISIDKPDIYV